MSFNYLKRLQELESQLPDYKIKYQYCNSDGKTFFASKYAHSFLIRYHRHEPTFDEELIGFMQISKTILRCDKDTVFASIKRAIEDSFNDAVQQRLATGKGFHMQIVCD